MKFHSPLIEGVFQKRYKRFFADIELNGEVVVAHVPNTGSLKSVNFPNIDCLISPSNNPERKLKFTLEMLKSPQGAWVGVNTSTPNTVIKESLKAAVEQKQNWGADFEHWMNFDEVKPEYKISDETRLDFVLKKKDSTSFHFIEVKNTTLAIEKVAQFPDAVTERGQKHLRELMALIDQGHTAEIVFTVQRNDCLVFAPADEVDPVYGQLLRQARQKGVKITPVVFDLSPAEVSFSGKLLPLSF